MDAITYRQVAERIAAAETEEERKEAAILAAFYYRFGREETTAECMAALRDALLEWQKREAVKANR